MPRETKPHGHLTRVAYSELLMKLWTPAGDR